MQQASEVDAEVVALFAMTSVTEFALSVPPLSGDTVDHLRARFLHDWCRPLHDAGIRYRLCFVEESPAHALVHCAEREHADLVVLGAHGHANLADRLLGSTSYSVSHAAPCPVLIVPPARAA